MNVPMLDLSVAWDQFYARIGDERGDEHLVHASDVSGCLYATYLRLKGVPSLPFDESTRAAFLMGFAVEDYVAGALARLTQQGYVVNKGREVSYRGIVGHLDYDLEKDGVIVAVVDIRTTKSKETTPKHDHVLKSAFYAQALGAPYVCEWVFSLGFGVVKAQEAHWFVASDFYGEIDDNIAAIEEMLLTGTAPAMKPPRDETWRCDKGYCSARCPRNAAYAPEEVPV